MLAHQMTARSYVSRARQTRIIVILSLAVPQPCGKSGNPLIIPRALMFSCLKDSFQQIVAFLSNLMLKYKIHLSWKWAQDQIG